MQHTRNILHYPNYYYFFSKPSNPNHCLHFINVKWTLKTVLNCYLFVHCLKIGSISSTMWAASPAMSHPPPTSCTASTLTFILWLITAPNPHMHKLLTACRKWAVKVCYKQLRLIEKENIMISITSPIWSQCVSPLIDVHCKVWWKSRAELSQNYQTGNMLSNFRFLYCKIKMPWSLEYDNLPPA